MTADNPTGKEPEDMPYDGSLVGNSDLMVPLTFRSMFGLVESTRSFGRATTYTQTGQQPLRFGFWIKYFIRRTPWRKEK